MKKLFASLTIAGLAVIVTFGPFFKIDIYGQNVRETINKQYVQVNLKDGKVLNFEYRSFIQMNLALQPDNAADAADVTGIAKTKSFGENRVLFKEKDSCREHRISLDNLQEMEFLGVTLNKCSQTKDWLFKVYLLDLDKYEGFFQKGELNLDKPLAEQGLKGQVLNTTDNQVLRFEDIEKITFFAR
ncbi:MAG: hypothetical protein NT166_30290 [Candidatus Aminicenantes bacterium]|nr:hypothetical protein [Candidatus Aminicenantes bacterium]